MSPALKQMYWIVATIGATLVAVKTLRETTRVEVGVVRDELRAEAAAARSSWPTEQADPIDSEHQWLIEAVDMGAEMEREKLRRGESDPPATATI